MDSRAVFSDAPVAFARIGGIERWRAGEGLVDPPAPLAAGIDVETTEEEGFLVEF